MRLGASARTSLRTAVCLLSALLSALAFAASAQASVGEQIVQHCTHGETLSGYSQQDYREALKIVADEAELEEYSPCAQLIRHAQLAALGITSGGSSSHPSGGEASREQVLAVTPAEERALEQARTHPASQVKVGGHVVRPGVVHANVASAASGLPTPLQVMIAFLLACALAGGVAAISNRVRRRA